MHRSICVFAAAISLGVLSSSAETSLTFYVDAQGFFTDSGKNTPGFGAGAGSTICGGSAIGGFRNYFILNLPANLLAPGQQVLSAKLVALMPFRGYSSSDASETWTIFDVQPSNYEILFNQSTPVTTATHVYADLGTGQQYGSQVVLPSDATSATATPIIVSLNAAFLAHINAKLALPGVQTAAFGGAITTLSGSGNQLLFGFSGYSPPLGGRGWLTLVIGTPCPGDLNNDGQVDDADFVTFASAYNLLDCADPAMPIDCSADLNQDTFVDDADFVRFAAAYDAFLCP